MGVCKKLLALRALEKNFFFLKDNEQWETLAYKDTGTTKDGRWDKQMKKKKKDNAFL